MKCVIPNYIPHVVTKKTKNHFSKWLTRYRDDLLQLYDTFHTTLAERYDEEFIPNEQEFLKFVTFIYSCSSQYIQDD